jgi:hypothetical protein
MSQPFQVGSGVAARQARIIFYIARVRNACQAAWDKAKSKYSSFVFNALTFHQSWHLPC